MPLLSKINQYADLNPQQIAFIEAEYRLSYGQLQNQVKQLSSVLLAYRKDSELRVAIALDRGINAAIALLSVVSIGGCYIPLDLKNPANRLSYITDDADIHCVIGCGEHPKWLKKTHRWLNIEQSYSPSSDAPLTISSESLAAILYTSGSTGHPKGVALSYRAISHFVDWATKTFKITAHDQLASLAPFHFDLSLFDLFSGLSGGATIHFVPAQLTLAPSRLTQWLATHQITVWYTVPSLLGFLTLKGSLAEIPLPQLNRILFAGEVFPTPLLIKLCQRLPQVHFYNLYGPTETNVCCYWLVDRHRLQANSPIPIGIPAGDAELIIDPDNHELQVRSHRNLSGYWQQGRLLPTLSADQFYRTGDKVSINQQGEYCYHGRLDRMLKCSGYRVEPAEIEWQLLQNPNVEQCAVLGIKDPTSGQRPVAVVVLTTGSRLTDIINPLKQTLPVYMQPRQFIVLAALPYLANGKIDYQTLQQQLEK